MRKKHEVTVETFEGFYSRARLCGSHGYGSNKSIDVITDPVNGRMWFEFCDHRTTVYTGPSLNEAIKLYNQAD